MSLISALSSVIDFCKPSPALLLFHCTKCGAKKYSHEPAPYCFRPSHKLKYDAGTDRLHRVCASCGYRGKPITPEDAES